MISGGQSGRGQSGVCAYIQGTCRFLGGSVPTIILLALGVALLFFATLTEARFGHDVAVRAYFGSLVAIWQYPDTWPGGAWLSRCWLALPGGPLIGLLALVNLFCAGLLRMERLRRKPSSMLGLAIAHAGLMLVLAGYFGPIAGYGNGFALAVAGGVTTVAGLFVHYAMERVARRAAAFATKASEASAVGTAPCRGGTLWLRYMPIAALLLPVLMFNVMTFVQGRREGLAKIFDGGFCLFIGLAIYLPALFFSLAAMTAATPLRRRFEAVELHLASVGLAFHGMLVMALVLIHGRPPVTGLRSVVIFCGWLAVLAAQRVELRRRDGIACFSAALAGLLTLCLAGGMAVAAPGQINPVIDVRHWLILHVVVICAAYSAVLLAVIFANISLLGGLFGMDGQKGRATILLTARAMTFGIVLGTIGTLMGGLWAMKAWGRFWGWDPKENAALMLILWCALALHARRVALVRERGFIRLVAAAGLVLAWSWAGTNMLGSGLHRYGLAPNDLVVLGIYALVQILLIVVSLAPKGMKPRINNS